MIKKYYSKYTGKQIDEAVAALIENNVKIEDLNEEVVELINSKANEGDLAALKEEVNNEFKVALEDLVGSASEPTPVPTSGIVETVYFNRSLTAEQVNEICSQLTFNIGSTCTYTLFRTAKDSVYIAGYWDSTTKSVYGFEIRTYNGAEYMNNEWQDYATNGTGIYEVNEEITYAGTQNDLLVNLVSITPFTASKGRVGELEAAVEELQNKDSTIRCDSVGESLILAYNGVSVDRNLTAEEAEVFNQFVNNENLTSLYAQVEGLADVVLTKSAYLTQDSIDIISFSAVIMDCYLDTIVCIYPEGSGVLGSIEISKRDLTMPKIAEECPYFGEEIYTLLTGNNVSDRKLTSAELDYFTNIKDKNSSLKITLKNTALQVHFYKYYTGPDRLIYRTIDENKIYSIIVYFGDDRGEEYVNTVGFDSNIFTEENEFNNLETRVETLEERSNESDTGVVVIKKPLAGIWNETSDAYTIEWTEEKALEFLKKLYAEMEAQNLLISGYQYAFLAQGDIDVNGTIHNSNFYFRLMYYNNNFSFEMFGMPVDLYPSPRYWLLFNYDMTNDTIIFNPDGHQYITLPSPLKIRPADVASAKNQIGLDLSTNERMLHTLFEAFGDYFYVQHEVSYLEEIDKLNDRVEVLESTIGDINTLLDDINGEVM